MKHIVKNLACLLFLALGHCVFANKNYMETSFKRGLNNQIICLMRACYEAHKNGYILIEPIFTSFLHKDDTNLKFSDIYDLDYFSESLKKYLTIIPYCEKKEDVIKYSPEYFLFNYKISKEENIKLLHLANLVRLSLKLNKTNLKN